MSFLNDLFGKKQPLNLQGVTDWHCHILPGVDDGVETFDESLEILAGYEQAGIADVWLTPHIMEDVPNTTGHLRERFAELQEAYRGPVKLHLAAENMIDALFMERLAENDLLPIGPDGRMLLVETSYYSAPLHFHDRLKAIKAKGYFPLLAHPERYNYIDDFDEYRHLRDMGVRFQLNLLSLRGHYGPEVRSKALRLLSAGYVDRFGTDLHRPSHLPLLRSISLPRKTAEICNQIILGS